MSTSSLQQLFEQAVYCIQLPHALAQPLNQQALTFMIGERKVALDAVLNWGGVNSGYFVTAYNPGGQPRSETENIKAQQKLSEVVEANGWKSLSGYSTDQSGRWPREDSLLIFCEDQAKMMAIGREFGQLAICQLTISQPVCLIMLAV